MGGATVRWIMRSSAPPQRDNGEINAKPGILEPVEKSEWMFPSHRQILDRRTSTNTQVSIWAPFDDEMQWQVFQLRYQFFLPCAQVKLLKSLSTMAALGIPGECGILKGTMTLLRLALLLSTSAYTEDISIAGSLLRDKISGLYESIVKRERRFSNCELTSSMKLLVKRRIGQSLFHTLNIFMFNV
ncbi:hypothetical protein OSTOST_04426 [Ostertagia ostertagi]